MIDDDVRDRLEAYRSAVLAKDVAAVVGLYADDVRVFDLWGNWVHEGREAWRANIAAWFASLGDERVEVAFDGVRTTAGDSVAAVDAFVNYRALASDGTARNTMRNRLTWVLERRENGWTIVHEHTSAPLDLATSKAKFG